jgi:hypothetical protein
MVLNLCSTHILHIDLPRLPHRYPGAATVHLPLATLTIPTCTYDEAAVNAPKVPPQPPSLASLAHFLRTSFALSAWKQAGGAKWSLRVNPSSGNLHPTECYVLSGPVPGGQ